MELPDYFSILAIVLALTAIVIQFLPLKLKLPEENKPITLTDQQKAKLKKAVLNQVVQEDKLFMLEAENRHLKDRYEKLLEAHKPLDYENRKIKEELVGLRKLVYLNNENTCQQCSPEYLEAMKEAIKNMGGPCKRLAFPDAGFGKQS